MSREAVVLPAGRDGVFLRELRSRDADEYDALVQRNNEHLTRLGDYQGIGNASAEDIADQFRNVDEVPLRFGVIEHGRLLGRVDLVPVEPPRYGLGYWLAADATGRGLATAAVAALLRYAQRELAATDVFAGISHGNERSTALLHRLGFQVAADFGTYTRFHLALAVIVTRDGLGGQDAARPSAAGR